MKRTEIADTLFSYYAQHSRRGAARAALAACVIATLPATGCRSGRPSWNMFSRGEPSAEVLAGSGPTTTYPSPPSSRAAPEAIASIAGGTSADPTQATPETSDAIGPPAGANAYALAGNRTSKPESEAPGGFPIGPAASSDPHPTVSTTVAADKNNIPPAYALPGRSTSQSTNDLAAAANGYDGVPAATSPSQPKGAIGLPSGYQLDTPPPAALDTAVASSPAPLASQADPTAPPASGDASSDAVATAHTEAPPTSGGFGLPSDMLPSAVNSLATATEASGPVSPSADTSPAEAPSDISVAADAAGPPDSTAVAALGLPPSNPTPLSSAASPGDPAPGHDPAPGQDAPVGGSAPEYQTASGTKTNAGGGGSESDLSGVKPVGYRPGSTGQSSGYPVLR